MKNIVKVIDLVPGKREEILSVHASELSENDFWNGFVCKQKPVIIRDAAKGWSAIDRWKEDGYLESMCNKDQKIHIFRSFNPSTAKYFLANNSKKAIAECIEMVRNATETDVYSIPGYAIPKKWQDDLGKFSFLSDDRDKQPRVYPRGRMFIYRNASTDWHCHPVDETLTTQILGDKKISMFRLRKENYNQYADPIEANFHHLFNVSDLFPQSPELTKYEGIIKTGDTIYIPPCWWHGIDPDDPFMGITVAHCFSSPLKRLASWKDPVTYKFLSNLTRNWRGISTIPFVGLMISASDVVRFLEREEWYIE